MCVYSFVSVFVCWTLTYWLAPAAAGRQASKQSMKEGRKEGRKLCLLACLLACEAIAFNWKISNSCGSNSKNGLFAKFGMWKKKMGSVVGVASWGGYFVLRSLILSFKVDNFSMGFTTFGAFVNNRVTIFVLSGVYCSSISV